MHTVVSRISVALLATTVASAALVALGAGSATAGETTQRPPMADSVASGGYASVPPVRVFDSRPGHVAAGGTRTFTATGGSTGVPASGVSAVVLNVTALTPAAAGYLTLYAGTTNPGTTTLNFPAGRQLANLAVVPLTGGGTVTVFNGSAQAVDTVVVVTGYFATGGTTDGSVTAVGPKRVVDTNTTTPTAPAPVTKGSIPVNGYKSYRVAGANGIPASAGGAIMNVTVAAGSGTGYVAVGSGAALPGTSNINLVPGQTLGTLSVVRLAADGTFTLFNRSSTPVRVVVDLAGWVEGATASTAGGFSTVPPARIFSTKTGQATPKTPLPAGGSRTIKVIGQGGLPGTGVGAVALTVTAASATAAGYLTVFGTGDPQPSSSALSFPAGITVPGAVIVPVHSVGTVTVYNGSTKPVDVVADVSGYVRNSDLTNPDTSVSRYIRNTITPTMSIAQVTAAATTLGTTDGGNASTTDPQVVLLQFGAQTLKAGGDGSGSGNQPGVRLSATNVRLTYPQVVAAVDGYVAGYANGRGDSATNPVTVAVGTSSSGFKNPDGTAVSYTPAAKGADWANSVVEPAVSGAAGTGITVVAGDDIEPNFDADIGEVANWIRAYLAAGTNPLINNGSTSQCPTTAGVTGKTCGAVAVDHDPGEPVVTHTWTQTQYWQVSGGIDPTRISLLPQIYANTFAAQWENISLSHTAGNPVLTFAGVLTSVAACRTGGGCSSITGAAAWNVMTQALLANRETDGTAVPAVTDLAIS